jgi:hypothetical protein
MKIAIITTIWKRPELTKIVLNYYLQFKDKYNLELICVGSEGDISRKLAKGWHYIEYKNLPVSEKHNQLLIKAKQLKIDGVILIGSDDLMSEEVIKYYSEITTENVLGFKDIYFYLCEQKELYYFKPPIYRQTIGAGRFFPKKVLEKMNWQLWDNHLNHGLDTNCSGKLKELGIKEEGILLSDIDGFIVDVKHSDNITIFAGVKHSSTLVDLKIMAKSIKNKNTVKEIQKLEPKVEEKEPEIDLEENSKYHFVSNGKDKSLKQNSEQFGFMCKILIKKGLGHVEGKVS